MTCHERARERQANVLKHHDGVSCSRFVATLGRGKVAIPIDSRATECALLVRSRETRLSGKPRTGVPAHGHLLTLPRRAQAERSMRASVPNSCGQREIRAGYALRRRTMRSYRIPFIHLVSASARGIQGSGNRPGSAAAQLCVSVVRSPVQLSHSAYLYIRCTSDRRLWIVTSWMLRGQLSIAELGQKRKQQLSRDNQARPINSTYPIGNRLSGQAYKLYCPPSRDSVARRFLSSTSPRGVGLTSQLPLR
ncbi:hypothetical protein C8Q77DRAFT_358750 [Trametes polyzona]|nr:hypothetical protein C8Q77DRAFT_358750 [Trametes polyzona]